MKLDTDEIHRLALELPNERLSREEQALKTMLPLRHYKKDFKERALSGGPLTFLECKALVKEQLTWKSWMVTFYEVAQFPQVRYFKDQAEAMKFFVDATEHGRSPHGAKLVAQRMEVHKPKLEIFGERRTLVEWKIKGYTPDPITFQYR